VALATDGTPPTEQIFKAPAFEDSVSGKPNPVQCRKDLPGAIYLSSELPAEDQAKAVGN
jgi:ribose transport system substrate-binding protein